MQKAHKEWTIDKVKKKWAIEKEKLYQEWCFLVDHKFKIEAMSVRAQYDILDGVLVDIDIVISEMDNPQVDTEPYIKCWAVWYDDEAQRRVGEFDIADEIHGISYELAGLLKDEIHAHYLEVSKTLKLPENTVMIEFIATNFSQDLLSDVGGEVFGEGELDIMPINYTATDDGETFVVSEIKSEPKAKADMMPDS